MLKARNLEAKDNICPFTKRQQNVKTIEDIAVHRRKLEGMLKLALFSIKNYREN